MNQQLETLTAELWAMAKRIVVDDRGHHPMVFCFGPNYKILAMVLIQGDESIPLRDAVRAVIEQIRPFGFSFVSEAWDRGLGHKRECIVLQTATREAFEMKRIVFDRLADGQVVLRRDSELTINSETPGAELRGAFPEMAELLPLLN